ncbi:uncharacterized protein BO96DRAFT_5898 [Aspergillus niger CBS 101883]|uniref:uncharacterized protein n=1 Tax=Aspergillus lacticoffeatus (strain CBS 101883) TaxID=1450533 RepID=UPI000D7F7184|nr:uncharacterized protein BO96DRAFT_5898 [Aspergillus niger CBS 101883]PYH61952.1 hypothetical protein BO96DRAFT_5898 [Aspergillus niger CBS 101883]
MLSLGCLVPVSNMAAYLHMMSTYIHTYIHTYLHDCSLCLPHAVMLCENNRFHKPSAVQMRGGCLQPKPIVGHCGKHDSLVTHIPGQRPVHPDRRGPLDPDWFWTCSMHESWLGG